MNFDPNLIQSQVLLKPFTHLKVGGVAEYFSQPQNLEELTQALNWASSQNLKITLLGGGSNTLISDQGIKGLTLRMVYLKECSVKKENHKLVVRCLAGTPKAELAKIFLKEKLAPALFLSGLPGDVGGGICMNAGVREWVEPREFFEIVNSFEVLFWSPSQKQWQMKTYQQKDIEWSYRKSRGWQPGVIVSAMLAWPLEPQVDIIEKVKSANQVRLGKQPLNFPNCGSVFKNPSPELSAGYLIESCGLKGHQIGGAQISEKHANFIVNKEQKALARDVKALIALAQEKVQRQHGVLLQPEVEFLGE